MISKATLLGRIGRKEVKLTQAGVNLVVLSIVTNRRWLDKNGQKQDAQNWHNVNCYNKIGLIVEKYAHIGDLIYIEGEIINKKSIASDGTEKWFYSVTANEIKLLPNPKREIEDNAGNQKDDDSQDESIPF